MTGRFYRIFIGIFFCLMTFSVIGQDYNFTTQYIDANDGLIGNRVMTIYEDSEGFMWMTTPRGLGRYDGHQFQWFTKINSSLRIGTKKAKIVEDGEGYLWLLSGTQVDLIHRKTFEVLTFEEKIGDKTFFKMPVLDIEAAGDGSLFLKDKEEKYYRYHPKKGLDDKVFLEKMKNFRIVGGKGWAIYGNKQCVKIDLNTGEKLKQFDIGNKRAMHPIVNYKPHEDWFSCVENNRLVIFKSTDKGIEEVCSIAVESSIRGIHELVYYNSQNDLLITAFKSKEETLQSVDLERQQFIPLANTENRDLTSLLKMFLIDSKGTIWGRNKKGIILLQLQKNNFYQYPPFQSVRGIWADEEYLFIRDQKISIDNSTLVSTREDFLGYGRCVELNLKEELWSGGKLGIIQIDVNNHSILQAIPSADEMDHSGLWSILRDKEGRWWGGTLFKGLFLYDPMKHDSIHQYRQYNGFEGLGKTGIVHLVEDGEYIWAASAIGLFLVHKERGVAQQYWTEAKEKYNLPIDGVHFLYKDKNKTYWAATSTEGLIRFRLNQKLEVVDFKQYTVEEGLSSNILYTIIEDDEERLWISTLNGISCFDKKTEMIQTFLQQDGISELEFNRISCTKGPNGRIYFGSLNGTIGFDPNQVIKKEAYDIPLYISKFTIYKKQEEKLIDKTVEVQQKQKIILHPNDRFFRMNVVMLDLFNAKSLRYSYKIEGLFDEFQNLESNTIEISGLPYGKYTLRVRGQGANRRYSTQELEIPLVVIRPFYLRWWFVLLSLGSITLGLYQVYRWRILQMSQRQKELELMVTERTAQIQKDKATIEAQAVQLKELDELKSKFFANISHELRTPLTLILAPLDNLINQKTHTNKEYTYLQMMRQNGKKLLKRINELLDLSRLDANRLEVTETPVFLYPFFKVMMATFQSAANVKTIQLLFDFQLEEDTQVLLDTDKVEKIVTNYLSNALKFTPKKGTITLTIAKKDKKLLISVRDTGVGIHSSELNKIFDRFYQAQNTNQQQGTGIGLSLCKELAKVLKGRVWATSGEGSVFYLELPMIETFAMKEPVAEEEDFVLPTIAPRTHKITQILRPNILIVEDHPDLRTYISLVLQEDYNIEAVENGQIALERLMANSNPQTDGHSSSTIHPLPSLIITDIMMPVMTGIELLTAVKNNVQLQHLPMIMLTARQSLDIKLEALRIGVDDYLTKPFKEEELKARVANLIKNSESRNIESTEKVAKQKNIPKKIGVNDLKWLKEVEIILLENVADPNFKLTDVAAKMAISYRRLQQKIKGITGLSPKQYQRSIKLNKARQLLKSGEFQTVTEVIYQLGFEHHNYFSKIYKQEFGIMPTEELK